MTDTWIPEPRPETAEFFEGAKQGKLRLQKWYVAHPDKTKKKITRELITTILARKPKMCSFIEWKDLKIVYKRLFHCFSGDNLNQLPSFGKCARNHFP